MREQIPRETGIVATLSGGKPTAEGYRLLGLCVQAVTEHAEEVRSSGGAMPGEFPEWDRKAWQRLEFSLTPCQCDESCRFEDYAEGGRLVNCPCNFMLMYHYHESAAAFKNRTTRGYRTA